MNWITNEYKRVFWVYLIISLIMGIFIPWTTGTWWVHALINFLGLTVGALFWIVARMIWATIKKKKAVDDIGS